MFLKSAVSSNRATKHENHLDDRDGRGEFSSFGLNACNRLKEHLPYAK